MTHNVVVSMGVDADIPLLGKAIVHDTPEYAMSLWHTGNPMDDMIRHRVIGPNDSRTTIPIFFWLNCRKDSQFSRIMRIFADDLK